MRKNDMIRIFICLIFIALASLAYSQNSRLKILHYENSSGEKGKTTFYYSEDKKNYKAKWELLDGSRHSINYHFLDDKDQLVRKYREFSDSITSNNFYKYDLDGNLVEDYFERSDGVKGIVWYKYENGKKIEAECRGLNGWFYGFIKYEYAENLLIKGVIYKLGNEIGTINYTYNENNELVTEFWDFGGKWTQTFTNEYEDIQEVKPTSYTYSSPFLKETKLYIVKEEKYDWNSEKGGSSIYEYQANKLVKKIYEYGDLKTITTYKYDSEGLLMKSFRKYGDGRNAEFSYHFNDNRQLIRRLFHGENGFVGTESYEYDEQGKLIKAEWKNFDSWLSGIITFNYDNSDKLVSGYFKGENNFDANITFDFDSNQNITKINWEFTFGKTQTYSFEYLEL